MQKHLHSISFFKFHIRTHQIRIILYFKLTIKFKFVIYTNNNNIIKSNIYK